MISQIQGFKLRHYPKLSQALKYLAWFGGLYLVFIVIYSLFFWRYVAKLETEFYVHVLWWFKNSGVWFVFSPLCLLLFSFLTQKRGLLFVFLGLGVPLVFISVVLQIAFDYHYLKDDLPGYFVLYLPRHAAIFILVCLYWYIFVFNKQSADISSSHSSVPNLAPTKELSVTTVEDTIELEHMGRPYKLNVASVWLIKSAGNYVEIESDQGQFLKRASLKQLHQELPDQFFQCHRSYIVNLHYVTGLQSQSSGNAVAILDQGEQVSVSKRYKAAMKARLAEFPIRAS